MKSKAVNTCTLQIVLKSNYLLDQAGNSAGVSPLK